jgi:hypothetical protein
MDKKMKGRGRGTGGVCIGGMKRGVVEEEGKG